MKTKHAIIVVCFLLTVVIDHFYGSLVLAKLTGRTAAYAVGKACSVSLTDCENTYFKMYVDAITEISNHDREFFENIIIAKDRAHYTGNCPCPYDSDSRGGSCGGRSSYSKHGQISYCYGNDISDAQIQTLKETMTEAKTVQMNNEVQKFLDVYNEKISLGMTVLLYATGLFYWL
jgi:hypothetical protein